ncbi:hypothetical protein [Marinobacter nauticus]|uniref:Uncharacterized protein n=1 Tax=Marinobacter nauticus TaxID=2743 RepID=A0A368V5G9_MARNT|nr:hypothetical protein [Marinobacter nauticus]RBP75539.1 hypothetical protein DET64_103139 [Marinobacter nauticus]RCW36348.1 hypothetical protein DET51_103139 [Marinobacter nauticus]
MTFTPEQKKAIQETVTSSVKVSASLGVALEDVETFQKNLREFIHYNHRYFSGEMLFFVFDCSNSGASEITRIEASRSISKGNGMFRVNKDLGLINTETSPKTLSDFSLKLSSENKFGVMVSKGSYINEILGGMPINEFDAIDGHKNLPFKGTITPRSMDSFIQLLYDHKANRIDDEKGFSYWIDKAKRTLRSDTKYHTEWIFQRDLFWWLDNFLTDKADVIAEPSGLGQDKHDIRVITTDGRRFVIEIKWLGKNINGTTYGRDRINEGLEQLKIYLDKDSKFYCGYLVAYDGRSLDKHKSESKWDEDHRHDLCEQPEIIFLKSETPSKEAERLVREAKNDPAN